MLTLSRTGWIDFTVTFVIVITLGAWNSTSRRGFIFSRVAVVVGVTITGIAMSPMIIKRISAADPTSVEYRLKWIKTARNMVEDNLVFEAHIHCFGSCPSDVDSAAHGWADAIDTEARAVS